MFIYDSPFPGQSCERGGSLKAETGHLGGVLRKRKAGYLAFAEPTYVGGVACGRKGSGNASAKKIHQEIVVRNSTVFVTQYSVIDSEKMLCFDS